MDGYVRGEFEVLTTGRLDAAKVLRFKTILEAITLTIANAKLSEKIVRGSIDVKQIYALSSQPVQSFWRKSPNTA